MTENEGDVFDYIELVESKNDKNTHLEHIEDFPITYGNKGLKDSIDFVEALHDMLKGNAPNRVFTTTKVDGAPAIFCGTNPENGKFFVATKSLFNKNPKINYTVRDIDKNHPAPGLNAKLKEALKALRPLNIRGIIQGDLLFDSTSKNVENIDGEQCITFKPNTIKYAIPVNSTLGAKINTSKFGIAFHTAYSGRTIATLKANFNVRVKQYANRRDIFVTDVYLTDVSGVATMTAAETKKVESMVGKIKSNLPNGNFLDKLSKSTLAPLLLTYTNSRIREGQHLTNIVGHYSGFKEYVIQKYDKEAAKLKTDKAKQTRANQRDIYINDIKHNRDNYMKLFVVQSYLNELKMFYMSKLNRIQHMGRAFFEMPDGSYKATTPEGYVAVSHERGNAVKLVDRLAFSRQNFLAPKSFGRRAISESWIKRHIKENMLEAYKKKKKKKNKYPKPKTPAGWVNYTYSAAPSGNGGGGDAGGGGE